MNRWSLRFALVALPTLVVAALVAANPQAHILPGDCGGAPGPAAVQALWSDADRIYVARADGRVDAVDRVDGRRVWTWPQTFTPDAGALSIVGDGQRIYIAVSEATNKADDPVIALDKVTGAEVWRTASLRVPTNDGPADPFRVALDRANPSDPYLYVGMNGGDILKLNRNTGQPLMLPDGTIARYHPTAHAGSKDPNGIYALDVNNGFVYAARDWGNLTRGAPVDLYNRNNTVLFLRTDLTPATGTGEIALTQTGGSLRNDGLFAMWHDGSSLYAAGSRPRAVSQRDVRPELVVHRLDLASSSIPAATRVGRDMGLTKTFGDGSVSYLASALSLTADASFLYMGTQTSGSLDGYVVRLNKDLTNSTDWPVKTSFGVGGVRSIHVNSDRLVIGHECSSDFERVSGAVVLEVPKARTPAAVLHKPQADLINPGRVDLVLRTIPLSTEPYTVAFQLQYPNGTLRSFSSLGINLVPTTFTPDGTAPKAWRGVRIPDVVPDAAGYRIRADIMTASGSFSDWAEGSFTLDRRVPDILDITPSPSATVTEDTVRIHIGLRDLDKEGDVGVLVDPGTSRLTMNSIPLGQVRYETNGLYVDIGVGQNLPLRQGLNDFTAEIRDRAGNLATRSWSLRLDSEVAAPSFVPVAGFVNDRRPVLQAIVPESVDLVSSTFAGNTSQPITVTDQVVRTAGNDGATLLQFRPAGDLSPAFQYEWRLMLRDRIGNANPEPFRLPFRVDEADPNVQPLEPLPGQLLIDDRPKIRFTVSDAGSGIQSRSVTLYLDGADRTRDLAQERDTYTLVLAAPLLPGQHDAVVTASDLAGNTLTTEWSFRVDLDSPKVQVDVVLPDDQTAVKQGDRIIVRVKALDDSSVRSVRLDARGLDASRGANEPMGPVPGIPGLFEANLTVKETRTLLARVAVLVDDHGGHQGLASADVRIDNNPPVTIVEPLPQFVGGSFELRWSNTPKDEAVGGSGIAYYRLEQQVGNQEWRTIRPRLTTSTLVLDVPDGAFRDLHYRIIAVDRAGNEQRVPSNVVDTVSRGDPFTGIQLPAEITPGRPVKVTATARDDLDIDDGLAYITLAGTDGTNHTKTLDGYGRLYMTNWNFTGVPQGDYIARLHFRAADGFELASAGLPVHIGAAAPLALDAKKEDTPIAPVVPLAAVAVAFLLRRRRA